MGKIGRYFKGRDLELNIGKTKNMSGKKSGGKEKRPTISWNGMEIEKVKEFNYLEYTLQGNNENDMHICIISRDAISTLGKVRSIAEGKLKENWNKRIYLANILLECIIRYGPEEDRICRL